MAPSRSLMTCGSWQQVQLMRIMPGGMRSFILDPPDRCAPWAGLALCRALAFRDDEVTAPLARADQALFPQQREGALGRALCDLVLLLEIFHGRQAAGQFAARDLPAEDRSELDVQR